MSAFPNSPRLIKDGIVLVDSDSGPVQKIIVLQYNPDTLTLTLQPGVQEGGKQLHQLAQLVGEQDVPSSFLSESEMDEIRGATFNAPHNAKARVIGRQIAQAVHQGFSQ
jgi:hypothetical protein